MRMKDKEKTAGKALKTINFDKFVLDALEKRAKEQNTTVSGLINTLAKTVIMTDQKFYAEMARHHYLEFQKYHYMKEQVEIHAIMKEQ